MLNQPTDLLLKEDRLNAQAVMTAMLAEATEQGLPFVCWKLPLGETAHAIVDVEGGSEVFRPDLEEMPTGFLVAPFQYPKLPGHFVRADVHFSMQISQEEGIWQGLSGDGEKAQSLFEKVQRDVAGKKDRQPLFHTLQNVSEQPGQQHFVDITQEAIGEIERDVFQKVVLSRNKRVPLPRHFHPFGTFRKLCQAYPDAFVSLVSLPGKGTWLGASPETLISVEKGRFFRTISLAGTQRRDKFPNLQEASWNQKEIEEQAMVSRYIINCFKKIRLREFEEAGPRTVAAGSLLHLRTDYKVDMEAANFPQLGAVMLELLHPTSAVCGMPKLPALDFILHKEGYDRALYSGYLGPVNMEGDTHVFVNLRCMQLSEGKAILYAGAGITHDSNPEKEFLETEMKMETMSRQIGVVG